MAFYFCLPEVFEMLKEKILDVLEENEGTLVTGGCLARRFGVSRAAVWKVMKNLKEDGYRIESIKNSGYKLLEYGDMLSERKIRRDLTAHILGNKIELLKMVDSTNACLKRADLDALQEGYVLIADGQSEGRGRRNKPFFSLKGEGVYMSVLLKPDMDLNDVHFITICAALAVCEAVESVCGISAGIKWVNDIYCSGKKLCGILSEGAVSMEMQTMNYIVVGVGINTGKLSAELQDTATSLFRLTGRNNIRNVLVAKFLNGMERLYLDLTRRNRKKELLEEYRNRQFILGKKLEINSSGDVFMAWAKSIDEEGCLVVEDDRGRIRHLRSEEVSVYPSVQDFDRF